MPHEIQASGARPVHAGVVARRLGCDRKTVGRVARRLGVGSKVRLGAGPPRWVFDCDEEIRLATAIGTVVPTRAYSGWAGYKGAHGLADLSDLADRTNRSEPLLASLAEKLGVGSRVRYGRGALRWVFTADDAALIAGAAAVPDWRGFADWHAYKREHDFADLADVAAVTGRSEVMVRAIAKDLDVGRHVRFSSGRERWVFAPDEVARIAVVPKRWDGHEGKGGHTCDGGCGAWLYDAQTRRCGSCASIHRSAQLRARWAARRLAISYLKAQGFVGRHEAVKLIDRSWTAIVRYADSHGIGVTVHLGVGRGPTRLFSAADLDAIREIVQRSEAPAARLHRDPERRDEWWRARHGGGRFGPANSYKGSRAHEIARERGKDSGRPRSYSDEQARHVYALQDSGASIRETAAELGLSKTTVERIRRFRI